MRKLISNKWFRIAIATAIAISILIGTFYAGQESAQAGWHDVWWYSPANPTAVGHWVNYTDQGQMTKEVAYLNTICSSETFGVIVPEGTGGWFLNILGYYISANEGVLPPVGYGVVVNKDGAITQIVIVETVNKSDRAALDSDYKSDTFAKVAEMCR